MIVWAASRTASSAERRIIAQTARANAARTRVTTMSSLGNELLSALVQGPVVVIVDSRKDAATALRLGADETVRVAQSVVLQKGTLVSSLGRATAHAQTRMRPHPAVAARGDYPGLALLMRVVEKHLGSPLNQAALKCSELAEELSRAIAVADGLMQRVRDGAPREELRGWSHDVKHYAQATLRAETLVSELRDEVERGDAIVRLLGDLSAGSSSATQTDVGSLLQQLAELLRADLGDSISLDVVVRGSCLVEIARPALLCIVCAAVENALENIRDTGNRGHLELRVLGMDNQVLVEVADDGVPGTTDLRTSILDSVLADSRTMRLRQLRERVRGVDGELTMDPDDRGTVLSIYFPTRAELATRPAVPLGRIHLERRDD